MTVEDKYNKPTWEYCGSVFFRKITGVFYTYLEFMFLGKILLILAIAVIIFTIFQKAF